MLHVLAALLIQTALLLFPLSLSIKTTLLSPSPMSPVLTATSRRKNNPTKFGGLVLAPSTSKRKNTLTNSRPIFLTNTPLTPSRLEDFEMSHKFTRIPDTSNFVFHLLAVLAFVNNTSRNIPPQSASPVICTSRISMVHLSNYSAVYYRLNDLGASSRTLLAVLSRDLTRA
jgi:hypothetical protein